MTDKEKQYVVENFDHMEEIENSKLECSHKNSSIIFEDTFQKAFSALMGKVYIWMTLALLITGFTAYIVADSNFFVTAMKEHYYAVWGLPAAELVLVFVITGRVNKLSLVQATILFILYSLLNGITLSLTLLVYPTVSVTKAFLVTAGTFGVMAFYGYTTKKDLTSIGKLLFFGLIGLIIATIANFFFRSSGFDLLISYAGVIIFIGLTAWDSQKIKQMLIAESQYGVSEHGQKIALLGALSLYLDFVNLFLYLVRIIGSRK